MNQFLNKLKSYGLLLLAAATAVLGVLFLYEKNKVEISNAILGEKKTDKILADTNNEIDKNNELLKHQESDRVKLEHEKPNEVTTDIIVDKFNKLK